MKTIRGVIGTLVIGGAFYLIPPDRDPQFMALPWNVQVAAMLGWILLIVGGIVIIVQGFLGEEK